MASFESRIILFILHKLNTKRSFEHYFKRGKLNSEVSNKPNRMLKSLATVTSTELLGRVIYTATPINQTSDMHVLFFHGGAYVLGLKNHHYNFISRLVKSIGCKVSIVDYPLAPRYTADDALDVVTRLYIEITEKESADKIVLMGDSSGGGLTLGLAQYLRDRNIPQPKQIILLSPWLDVTMQNPDILAIDKLDPILSIEGLKMAGEAYAGNKDPKDPYISPIYGNFKNLSPISLFTSTNDILNADARKLKGMLDQQGIMMRVEEYSGLFHDWMVFNSTESRDVIAKITEIVTN
ncbi:MAG: alpha/beta hydrolase [Erysipelotrichaceae bacterium]|nr:alpha/beta hydrolase [Erysipelotrichaceae bacterium]